MSTLLWIIFRVSNELQERAYVGAGLACDASTLVCQSHLGDAIAGKPAPTFGLRCFLQGYSLIQVAFSSVYLSNACSDLSRPLPDCLKPPNGAVMSPPSYWLTHTLPARRALAVRCALEMFDVHTAAARPYWVSLAIAMASSTLSKAITDSTGPKISSWAIFMALVTPSKIVGST